MKTSMQKTKVLLFSSSLLAVLILIGVGFSGRAFSAGISQWTATTPYPVAFSSQNAVINGDFIYVLGGKTAAGGTENPLSSVLRAQIHSDGTLGPWQATAAMPAPRYIHATAADSEHLYVVGGWDGRNIQDTVWRATFLPDGNLGDWISVTRYPTNLTLHKTVIVGGRIYVMGGWTGSQSLHDVRVADLTTDGTGDWRTTKRLPQTLYRMAAAATSDTIYVVGGYTTDGKSAAVYYAQPQADGQLSQWMSATALPTALDYASAVIHDGRLVVMGGNSNNGPQRAVYAAVIQADGSLGAWSAEPPLPVTLFRFAAAATNHNGADTIYVVGGLHDDLFQAQSYFTGVPQPTATPTATVRPTPTATPVPSVDLAVTLQNSPAQWVAPGDEILYTIDYSNHGDQTAADVHIHGRVPSGTELIADSIPATVETTGVAAGSVIDWEVGQLPAGAGGRLTYRVRRAAAPTPPVPLALAIDKVGPATAEAGAPIAYTLTISNLVPVAITNVVVEDELPVGATYVSGGDGPPEAGVVRWSVGTLAPESSVQLTLVVTANHTIVNHAYRVSGDNDANAAGLNMVVTTIAGTQPPRNADGVVIANPYVEINWLQEDTRFFARSNAVRNPAGFDLFLPLVTRR